MRKRLTEQVKAVWLIVLYLIAFQTLLLEIPIFGAAVIAVGVVLVVVGLTFFMEGLLLGLMPLGELIGIRLPQKSRLPTILLFAFILGVGATFAEPAVGVLKVAGSTVKAWDAPLLFLLLNRHSDYLVYAIGMGVGIAVVFGMLRFLFGWSLKPFIYILIPLLLGLSIWSAFEPNMIFLTGLAWDCGGVTTGPVTVPLVLALGIGVCRVVAREGESGGGGFGVVTLASAFPIVFVLGLGLLFLSSVPKPMNEAEFLGPQNRAKAVALFESEAQLASYAMQQAGPTGQLAYFGGNREAMTAFQGRVGGRRRTEAAVAVGAASEADESRRDHGAERGRGAAGHHSADDPVLPRAVAHPARARRAPERVAARRRLRRHRHGHLQHGHRARPVAARRPGGREAAGGIQVDRAHRPAPDHP